MLKYVREGFVVARVEGREYWFGPGEFCLIEPGVLHDLRGVTDTVTPYAHFDVFYNPRRNESFVSQQDVDLSAYAGVAQPRLGEVTRFHLPMRFVPPDPADFSRKMLRMVDLWQHEDALAHLETQHLAMDLLVTILKAYGDSPSSSVAPDAIDRAMSYIVAHLEQPLSVATMARRAQLSDSRFSKAFKGRFGAPPHQVLIRLRVQRAQDLLRHTHLTLERIAQRCGFADVHHFAKTFASRVGESPGAYRRRAGSVVSARPPVVGEERYASH